MSIGGLIFLQPDLSAAVTIFILGWLLFFLAGGEMRQIILFSIVALAAGWLVVQFSPTGRARISSYIAGLKDPLQSSDHVLWSLESIFKGKLFGVGIGQATTKLIGLPFAATDSIFAVIVEELGLVGALGLVCLYARTCMAWSEDRWQAPDFARFRYGRWVDLLDRYRGCYQHGCDGWPASFCRKCPALCQCGWFEPDLNIGCRRYSRLIFPVNPDGQLQQARKGRHTVRLLICAGGTGGGVYPALAVLQSMQDKAEVLWVGGEGGMEAQLVAAGECAV